MGAPTAGGAGSEVEVDRGGDVSADEVTWPRPAAPGPDAPLPRWRFSGRWWTKPVPLRRNRPW
jgi:hypothetical protein